LSPRRTASLRHVVCCVVPLLGTPCFASDTLEEVLVTARSIEDTLPLELARYGHDIEVLTAERIRAAGYVDVSSALQSETPGLFVAPRSGPFDYVDISLQGSRAGDVLWLVDGVRISNRIYNDTSPDTLPANMVERVEVLKGAESLFYGTQAVAGAINMVTRAYSQTPDGEVSLGFDSNDGYHASGYGRGALGAHKFVAYGSKDQSDGYEQYDHFEPSATDRRRSYDVANAGLKYGYDFSDAAKLDLLWHHTDARLDNNSAARTRRSYNDRDEDLVSARFNYAASAMAQLSVKGYLHYWDTTYANIQNDPATGAVVVVYPPGTYWGYKDYGASALVRLTPGGPAEYHVGYDYQNYKGRDAVFPIDGQTETVHALFAHVRTTPGALDDVTLAAGVRYNDASAGEDATVWNVSGRYQPSDSIYVAAVVGTTFLLPSAEQLYYIGDGTDEDYVGNPNLKPESSRNINVSIGGKLAAAVPLTWQLTGFARDIDRLIDVSYDDPAHPGGIYENVPGKVEVRGAEATFGASITAVLRASASYTYAQSRDAGSNLQRPGTPESYAKAQLTWSPVAARYELSAALNWVGDVYKSVGTFGRVDYGNYSVVDVAGQLFVGADRRNRVGVSLRNVFDEEYTTYLTQVRADDDSGNVLVSRLGVPRTLQLTYSRSF